MDHLGDVSEIESVMALGWCGLELFTDFVIDIDRSFDNIGGQELYFRLEPFLSDEPVNDALEDVLKGLFRGLGKSDHVHMSGEPHAKVFSTSSRWSCSSDGGCSFNILPVELFIVESFEL